MTMQPSVMLSAKAREHLYRVRPLPALAAGLLAGVIGLAGYYTTLAMLPVATDYPLTQLPVAAWSYRLDLAQFLGTIVLPPYPTLLTWTIGLVLWLGTLSACGLVYAILLAWALQLSEVQKGIGFGVVLFIALAFGLSLAQGNHPATMRNALPDTGLFLLGWSAAATVQLFLVYVLYGAILGALYRRWTLR